jgi:hypothetical protein
MPPIDSMRVTPIYNLFEAFLLMLNQCRLLNIKTSQPSLKRRANYIGAMQKLLPLFKGLGFKNLK